jgi:GDP-L-fucose synthase
MSKKILITGGRGFLGRNFYEKLSGDYDLVLSHRASLDLNDSHAVYQYLKKEQFDVVIHTATYDAAPKNSPKDSQRVLDNNLRMFFNITRCEGYFGKMLYFGSGAEFGRENWTPKMTESYFDEYVPVDQYGYSKYLMTKHTQLSSNIYNLRLFGVYGEYDDWRYRFISNICCHALFDLPITVHKNSRVDSLYVNDLVRIVQWFIDNKPRHQVYNICTGGAVEHVEWAKELIGISEKKLELIFNQQEKVKEYSGDNTLLMTELSSFQFTSMSSALSKLYAWYNSQKKNINIVDSHY